MIQLKLGQILVRFSIHPRCVCIMELEADEYRVIFTDGFGEAWTVAQFFFEYEYKGGLWLVPWKVEKYPVNSLTLVETINSGRYQGIRYDAELARSLAHDR